MGSVGRVTTDFHVLEFARMLSWLEEHPPVTAEFTGAHPQKVGTWWTSEREHMVSWFRAQSTRGTGAYSRQEPNTSARTAYNRLFNAGSILWIGEALGEERPVVQAAADEAAAEPNVRRRPAIMRRHLPWPRIAELAAGRLAARARLTPMSRRLWDKLVNRSDVEVDFDG